MGALPVFNGTVAVPDLITKLDTQRVELDARRADTQARLGTIDDKVAYLTGTAGYPRQASYPSDASGIHQRISKVAPTTLSLIGTRLPLHTNASVAPAEGIQAVTYPNYQNRAVKPVVIYRDANVVRYVTCNVKSYYSSSNPFPYRFIVSVVDFNRTTKAGSIRFQQVMDHTGFNPNTQSTSNLSYIYSMERLTQTDQVASSFLMHMRVGSSSVFRKLNWDDANSVLTYADLTYGGGAIGAGGSGTGRRVGFVTPDGVYAGHIPYDDLTLYNVGMLSRRLDAGAPLFGMGVLYLGNGQGLPGTMQPCIERVGLREWASVAMGVHPLTGLGQPCVNLVRASASGVQRNLSDVLFLPCDTLSGSATISYLADNLFAVNVRANGVYMSFLVGYEDTPTEFFPKRLVNYTPVGIQTGAAGLQWVAVPPSFTTNSQIHPLMTKEVGGAGSGLGLLIPTIGGTASAAATRSLTLTSLVSKADASGFLPSTTTNSLVIGTGAGATDLVMMDLVPLTDTEAVLQWYNYVNGGTHQTYNDFISIA